MKITIVFLCALFLSACGTFNKFFPDKSKQYQGAQVYDEIKLPEGMDAPRLKNMMPIPEVAESLKSVPLPDEVHRPAALKVELMALGVQKRSTGDRHWIFIDKPASKVWPELSRFVKSKNAPLALMYPEKGMIETDWYSLSVTAKTMNNENYLASLLNDERVLKDESDKRVDNARLNDDAEAETYAFQAYRFRLEVQLGLQRNTSRVVIVVDTDIGAKPAVDALWPDTSENLNLEHRLLSDVAEYLAERLEEKSSV